MRTSELLGLVGGGNIGQGKAEGVAQEIVPIEIVFDKVNDITVGILAEHCPCLVDAQIIVFTGFNAAGTDTMSIGSGAGTNLFNAQTVASPGLFTAAAPILIEDENETITVAYDYTSTAPTAGRAIVLLKVTPLLNYITQRE